MSNTITEIHNYIKAFIKSKQYQSAIFWAQLLLSLRKDSPSDLYIYAEVLFYNEEYRRVIDFIERHSLHNHYLTFRLLAARSYFAIEEYMNAIKVLDHNINSDESIIDSMCSVYLDNSFSASRMEDYECDLFGHSTEMLENNCYYLLGEIHEKIQLRDLSLQYYKLALKANIKCYASAQKLHSSQMMSTDEAREFLLSLDYDSCGDKNLAQVLRESHEDLFGINRIDQIELKLLGHSLAESSSVMLNAAFRYYNNAQYQKAYDITKRILDCDPHNNNCTTLYASVMFSLKYTNELYTFANSLIANYPEKKESWYASGCYYLSSDRLKNARIQFLKATEIDKYFGLAWIALGHIYNIDNERDHAIMAYCSANQAMKGSYIPNLYIAVEHSLSNHYELSIFFIKEAMTDGSQDPHFWHERGFIEYNHKNYHEALNFFLITCKRNETVRFVNRMTWEPLFNNIAHCYYKLGDFERSLEYFKKAMGAKPNNPSTMVSMVLVYARQGRMSKAIDILYKIMNLNEKNLMAESLMKIIVKNNAKKSVRPPHRENSFTPSILNDSFKLPQMLLKNIPYRKSVLNKSFDGLKKMMDLDCSIDSTNEHL